MQNIFPIFLTVFIGPIYLVQPAALASGFPSQRILSKSTAEKLKRQARLTRDRFLKSFFPADQAYFLVSSSSNSINNKSSAPTEICSSRKEISIETIIRINAIANVHCPPATQPANRANILVTQKSRLSTP